MLLGLIGMGVFGLICLVVINLYHKQSVGGVSGLAQPVMNIDKDYQGH